VGYGAVMRMHISLDDELVAQLDQRVGARGRSAFISATVRKALEDERRWEDIEAGLGALIGSEHEWDTDPAAWVRAGRAGDPARLS
jgi:metal-responsive CopG/Arc/MetJ family transcriptional regulator